MNFNLTLLAKSAREGKLAHLLLFHGGSSAERREMSRHLAKILNCGHPNSQGPCETCPSCRKISTENHPDVNRLEPLKSSIGIEQVLAWQERIYRKHFEGKYKVSLIEQAESLTIPAANALLKVIEEPPERTIIILSAENAEGLLPTIQSRAQIVFFPTVLEQDWLRKFSGGEEQEAKKAFALAGKNPDLAQEVLGKGINTVEKWIANFEEAAKQSSFIKLFSLFPLEKEEALLYLQVLANIKKDSFVKPRDVIAIGKAIDAIRQQVSPRLAIEVLALELFEQGGSFCG